MAACLRGIHFATGKGHRLKDAFAAKRWLFVRLFLNPGFLRPLTRRVVRVHLKQPRLYQLHGAAGATGSIAADGARGITLITKFWLAVGLLLRAMPNFLIIPGMFHLGAARLGLSHIPGLTLNPIVSA